MKTALAVIVACLLMLVGWLLLAALLYALLYVASQARQGLGLMHLLNILLMWLLGPGFGGFVATYATPRIFKTIDPSTIATSFISVVTTLAAVLGLLSLMYVDQEAIGLAKVVVFILQVAAIVIGAKIGRGLYIASTS